jgi:methylated-DNA-protein-cysteine methyltransferase related protein
MSWEAVYRFVKKVPRGRVTTYGRVARALRLSGGARAAGYAMAGCPRGLGVPWHRVVGSGGRILISEPHASLQLRLLETEGVVLRGRRVDLATCGWPPTKKPFGRRKRKPSPGTSRSRKRP